MFLYAMWNRRNGYVKIGRSTNPKYRERTLQAEEPEVYLLNACEADPEEEAQWHQALAEFRVRGEWFDLPAEDLEEVLAQIEEANYLSRYFPFRYACEAAAAGLNSWEWAT